MGPTSVYIRYQAFGDGRNLVPLTSRRVLVPQLSTTDTLLAPHSDFGALMTPGCQLEYHMADLNVGFDMLIAAQFDGYLGAPNFGLTTLNSARDITRGGTRSNA